ncbi:MAG: GTP-binding protein [Candidatus Woesearchaeota archaeon]
MGIPERIKEIEDAMRKWQYNKATEHAFGVAKAQIARLREKMEKEAAKKSAGAGFFVKKSGDATVILLGFPSVGKSTLLNKLTGAKSKTAAYAFTTLSVIPGVLQYNQAKIQILDVPGIVAGAASGRGRGKEVLAMVRSADLILILIDALHPEHYPAILKEVYDVGVRINQEAPDVKITKKTRGGIDISATVPIEISKETIKEILHTFRINNADVVIRSPVTIDSFIDAVEGNKKYIPAVTVVTKFDLLDEFQQQDLIEKLNPDLAVSAEQNINIEELKELIFTKLNFVRIFLKEVGKKPDLEEPMVLRKGSTIETVCSRIHKDFVRKFKFAKIWGKSAKFPGQQFRNLDKQLEDGDIVEIHVK